MGGDDLNDDLLQWSTEPVVETQQDTSDEEDGLADDDDDDSSTRDLDHGEVSRTNEPVSGQAGSSSSNKRKSTESKEKNQKRQKQQTTKTPEQLMLQAGRDLVRQDCAQQAAFLTMALRHYTLMEQRQNDKEHDDVAKMEILPSYIFLGRDRKETLDASSSAGPLFLERIRDAVSVQKMKKWKHVGSPCVVCSFVRVHACSRVWSESTELLHQSQHHASRFSLAPQ